MKVKTASFTIVFFLLFNFLPAASADAGESKPSPRARFEQTTYKFAAVIAGTDVTHSFKINNKGDAPLNIVGVYSE